jgi:hypothetical protein
MGMFSGFQSKQLETSYNKMVFATLFVLQKALVLYMQKFTDAEILTKKEVQVLRQTYGKLLSLESVKKEQPKFTLSLKALSDFFEFS